MFSDIAAVELENLRRDKKEGWLQLRMEERGRRVEDEQGGVVVIDLRPRENIVAGFGGAGLVSHVVHGAGRL